MKKTELNYEDGKQIYEVEFEKGTIEIEREYVIDAVTGDILKFSKETD